MLDSHPLIRFWEMPGPHEIGSDVVEFLEIMGKPTWITIKGKDPSRLRVVVTLLHGNEPSGVKAIYRWLRNPIMPATNMAFFIGYVDAALEPQLFTHRFLPSDKDLNRCFAAPYESRQEKLAFALIEILQVHKPEAVFDLHNTSSNSEPFAVTFMDSEPIRQLSTLLTQNLLLMQTKLGTLLEHSKPELPIITIEFGKGTDPRSDHLAITLLDKLINLESLFAHQHDTLRLLRDPIRLELASGSSVAYSDSPVAEADVTILHSIDTYNFLDLNPHTIIGWVHDRPEETLKAHSANGQNILTELFSFDDGKIRTRQKMTLSMATTDPAIATGDCLAYLIPNVQPETPL
jgi:hypothetical protein